MRGPTHAVIATLVLFSTAHAQSPQIFPVVVEPKPQGTPLPTIADVDADGVLDAVLIRQTPPAVLVQLGLGLGWFADATATPLPGQAWRSATADFDRDGRLDVAVMRFAPKEIDVLRDFDDGAFGASTTLAYTGPADTEIGLVAGDFDGDGLDDLAAVPRGATAFMEVFLGDGTGQFGPPITTPSSNGYNQGQAVADFNGDDRDDLVVARWTGGLHIYLASGAGAFAAPIIVDAGYEYFNIDAGDADGDGDADLLAAALNLAMPNVRGLLLGRGDGSGALQFDPIYPTANIQAPVEIVDVDGDGLSDLFAAVSLFRGIGGGSFAPEQTITSSSVFYATAVADIDGSGVPDLIAGTSISFSIAFATAPLEYPMVQLSSLAGARPSSSASADFNGDGLLDVCFGDEDEGSVRVVYGNGDGSFTPPVAVGSVALPWAITAADFDANGRMDIAVGSWAAQSVRILLGGGANGFTIGQVIACGGGVQDLAVSDLNGDGVLDIAVATGTGPGVAVLKGVGNGTFSPAAIYSVPVSARGICALDADGDPYRDLAVACYESQVVQILRGSASGTFVPGAMVPVGAGPWEPTAADLDGDGDDDLAIANLSGPGSTVLANDGQGTFVPFPTQPDVAFPLVDLAIVDVDGDGWDDLAGAVETGGAGLARGNGRGEFEPMQFFGFPGVSSQGYGNLVVGDFTSDGRIDLVTARRPWHQLCVYEQRPVALLPLAYCVAKPSSNGCVPAIQFDGLPRASATSGFTIGSIEFRNQKSGVLAYSVTGHATTPFTGGTLCVAPGVKRTPGAGSGGTPLPAADCTGQLAIDFAAFSHGLLGGSPVPALLTPGTHVWAQWVARDPGYLPPNATMLSNALAWTVFP